MDQSLAVAYSVKRKNAKKMSQGGMVDRPPSIREKSPSSLAQRIIAGQKAKGEGPQFDQFKVSREDEDFLSGEEQDYPQDLTYPDPDGVEDTEGIESESKAEDPDLEKIAKKRKLVTHILGKVRQRNMGKTG